MAFSKVLPWIILFVSALNVIFLGGKRRAFGIFIAELHVEFNNTTTLPELNWIGDSYAALGYMTTTISSAIILCSGRRFRIFQFIGACFVLMACITSAYVPNPHYLFFTHTILHGIGSSLILSVVGLVVNEHFDKNHKYHILATTLVSGGSVASIVFIQFYAYLIEQYGWRHAFLFLGVIYFVVNSSASLVFVKNPNKADYKQNKCSLDFRGNVTREQIPLLVLWTLDRIMTSIVTYGMLLNLADYMRRREPTLTRSTLLTTLFAAGEASTYAIGTVVTAMTQNLLKNRLRYIILICTFVMANILICWEFLSNHKMICRAFAYIAGFCLGPSITFLFPAGEELTSLPGHLAYPFSLAGMGFGMLLSPLLSALIAMIFEYKWFFLVQGSLIYVKFFCILSSTIILHRQTAETLSLDEDYQLLLTSNGNSSADKNGLSEKGWGGGTGEAATVDSDEESIDLRER